MRYRLFVFMLAFILISGSIAHAVDFFNPMEWELQLSEDTLAVQFADLLAGG